MNRRKFLGGLLGAAGLFVLPGRAKAEHKAVVVQFKETRHLRYHATVLYAWTEIDGVVYEWAGLIDNRKYIEQAKENARVAVARAIVEHRHPRSSTPTVPF